jgi:hypothetical protein
VNKVAELQRVADKKDRGVIAGHVPVAFFGIELQRKSPRVSLGVSGTLFAPHRGKADERWSFLANGIEQLCRRVLCDFLAGADEISVSA